MFYQQGNNDMSMNQLIRNAVGAAMLSLASVATFAQVPVVPPTPATYPTDGSVSPQATNPTPGNGGLFVQAFDPITGASLTEWLGLNFNGFQPGNGNATPNAGLNLNFGTIGGSLWASTFGSDTNPIDFSVTSANGAVTNSYTLLTTLSAAPGSITNAGVTNAINGETTAVAILTGSSPCTSTQSALANPCQTKTTTDNGYLAVTNIGQNFNAGFTNIYGTAGGAGLDFYTITQNGTKPAAQATVTQYQNSTGAATWTLSASGDLVYNVPGGSGPPVPLPAAVWLLGSGLLGLAGIGRRRNAAAA
jgi:hypothetical protein